MHNIYNPTQLIQTISQNLHTNAGHKENNNMIHHANALHRKINASQQDAMEAVGDGIKRKYVPIIEHGFNDFSANPIAPSDYYPDFTQNKRNYLETKTCIHIRRFPSADLKHQCGYQLARASRSFPEFSVTPNDPIEKRREAVKDALCFMAYVLNATIELAYCHNAVTFYEEQNKSDQPTIVDLVNKTLNRVNHILSNRPDKHKAYKSIIFGELDYENEDSAIPNQSCLKPYGIREVSLMTSGYDPKSNTVLDASSVQEILPLFNLVRQSYIRLPVTLLAAACSEQEIKTYYKELYPADNYGMKYNLNATELIVLTLKHKELLKNKGSTTIKEMTK
jgi:hypothetical protein